MTRLHDLYERQGQSPWLDNLKRSYLTSGHLTNLVAQGIRGVTSNPTIFQKAITGSADYDAQLAELVEVHSIEGAYWEMVQEDIRGALEVLRPVYDQSGGSDGFVSIEVSPALAADTPGTITAARFLHEKIDQPNLLVKIPATAQGIPAIQQSITDGGSVNITLIFSLDRYAEVMDAYLSGLEARKPTDDLSATNSVASFFVSRVDTEVDRRLEALGTPAALGLRGRAAVAQARLAYQLFLDTFSGSRWDALGSRGARMQRPLWASTSTKNPVYRDLLYVDSLIGPQSVNTLPDATVDAFIDHGVVARTVDQGIDEAAATMTALAEVGIDMADVSDTLENEGVAAFSKSFDELLQALTDKAGPGAHPSALA